MPTDVSADPRWMAILARDPAADGRFWYSVATTGVYCRPSCPSRPPRPANVRLHDTVADARAAGARACRRCNPDGLSRDAEAALLVERACRMIEAAEVPPTLASLAESVQLSPGHFHRMFKRVTGLTPKQFMRAGQATRARAALAEGASVTTAIHDAGYGSSSRFYDGATRRLGMRPARYRAGGRGETLRFAVGQCSLGAILVCLSDKGVAAILLGDEPQELIEDLQRRFPAAELIGGDEAFDRYVAAVVGRIEAPATAPSLPLDIRGTAFQERVWAALARIPPGTTRSYAEVAAAIGRPSATRAVAAACAANRHAVIIPCHRVVRTDGDLSGYRWGIERKRLLLDRERRAYPAPQPSREE